MDQDDREAADENARAQDCETDEAPADDEGGEPETFELELDGQAHTLPAALKGAFLRQADYTRKTQELAQHRRALEADRAALAEQAKAHDGALSDRAHLAALDQHLRAYEGVDWRGLAQQDPARAQALWARFEHTRTLRDDFAQAVAHHEHGRRLSAAREAAEAMAHTGRALAEEIEGWGPELAAKLTAYARSHGVTLEELQNASDPRIWKILHKAHAADQAGQRDAVARAPAVRPAISVSGAAGGAAGVRDELGTKEWMQRRAGQLRRAR